MRSAAWFVAAMLIRTGIVQLLLFVTTAVVSWENCPYIKLPWLRAAIAVKRLGLVYKCIVLTSRMPLHQMSLRQMSLQRESIVQQSEMTVPCAGSHLFLQHTRIFSWPNTHHGAFQQRGRPRLGVAKLLKLNIGSVPIQCCSTRPHIFFLRFDGLPFQTI